MVNVDEYFEQFFRGSRTPSLEVMKYFMKEYNDFQSEMKFIHIAGTNGKGSCVETISNILIKQGYKVGKFISPHLVKYNERIIINNIEISNKEMIELIKELDPKIEKYNKENKIQVSYFELITIMALLYYYRNNVDFVVLETGLGGLFDSTNIITNPLVSIITSIGYDHMQMLGNTLTEIAYNKAGIIKQNSSTVFFEQTEDVNEIFKQTCLKQNNQLHLITEDKIHNYRYDNQYQYFDYEEYKNMEVVLKGKKQIRNAAICIECMKILNNLGYNISINSIREGLKTVVHKGRMEILNKNPLIIYDGAHNEPAIENLMSSVKMYYSNFKRVYIVSILKRKDYAKMVQMLLEDKEAEFVFTSGNDLERYTSKEELYNVALKNITNQKIYMKDLEDSINDVFKQEKTDTVHFIVGSFYTYGTAINLIKKENFN